MEFAGGGGGDIDDLIAGAGLAPTGGGMGPVEQEPYVYMGEDDAVLTANEAAGSVRRIPVDKVAPLSGAQDKWYAWDDDRRQRWADHLIEAGVIDEEDRYDYAKLQELWMAMTEESANAYTRAGREVTPWQMANLFGGGDESGATAASLGRATVGEEPEPLQRYTQSNRSRNVQLTDPTTAKALLNQVLGKALGRHADDEDMDSFLEVLRQAERDNPVITDTTTKYRLRDDESGYDTTTTSTSRGGVDAGQVLMDEAMDDPEYGAYQASTTYWNALEAALGTIGGNDGV